jgi:pimeloyl-ACP methyl ester carboxylesterase
MPASSTSPESGASDPGRSTALTRLWQILRVVILVWLGVLAFLTLSQQSMIYYPTKEEASALQVSAATRGFQPWKNTQGETIGYRNLPASGDQRAPLAVLITHGNAGYALHRAGYAPILRAAAPDRAVSVYVLEYPGYGAREGHPSQEGFLAAADEALARIPAGVPVVILGESIGTGVASATAAAHPDRISALLLLTPFDSLANVAQHHYPLLPVRWILRDQYPSATWLKKYQGPVAVILAANDSIVPAKFGQSLFDAYSGPKKLIIADQADHNDLLVALTPSAWSEALGFLLGN